MVEKFKQEQTNMRKQTSENELTIKDCFQNFDSSQQCSTKTELPCYCKLTSLSLKINIKSSCIHATQTALCSIKRKNMA